MSIGELSRLTGVPVRTIRFYCDEGILHPRRSSGGHRLFDPAGVERLHTVRRLRAVGVGLPVIADVLAGSVSVSEAAAGARAVLDAELGALAWRRAALDALEHTDADERLVQLTAVHDRHRAHDQLIRFWRRLLGPAPRGMFDAFADMNIPAPPEHPTARQVLTYAELVTATTDPAFAAVMSRQLWRADPAGLHDKLRLLTDVAEACTLVGPLLGTDVEPRPGPELDLFLTAHAAARRQPDTPRFRRRMREAADDFDPRVQRYWTLTGRLTGTVTTGHAQHWLHRALARDTTADPD